MALVKGPFDLYYGANLLAGIETVDLNYDVDTDDYSTIQGRRYTISGAHSVSIVVTFLESDVASLATILPQYFVANGGHLSTGETVSNSAGAIDVVPGGCNASPTKTDAVLVSCGNPGHVLRVVDCTTEIDGVDVDGKIRKVSVRLQGESTAGTIQMFAEGAVNIVS